MQPIFQIPGMIVEIVIQLLIAILYRWNRRESDPNDEAGEAQRLRLVEGTGDRLLDTTLQARDTISEESVPGENHIENVKYLINGFLAEESGRRCVTLLGWGLIIGGVLFAWLSLAFMSVDMSMGLLWCLPALILVAIGLGVLKQVRSGR